MIGSNVFTEAIPPVTICAVPAHLLRGDLDGKPIRFTGIARFLSWPIARRGELLSWAMELPALVEGTPLLGPVWDCAEVRRALKRKDGTQFLQYVDPGTAALLR